MIQDYLLGLKNHGESFFRLVCCLPALNLSVVASDLQFIELYVKRGLLIIE